MQNLDAMACQFLQFWSHMLLLGACLRRHARTVLHHSINASSPLQFWSHMLLLEAYLRRHGVRPAVLKRGMQSQAKQDALSL